MKPRIDQNLIPDELFKHMMSGENYIHAALPDQQLLELMRYYVSHLNGCAYCLDMHYQEAIAAGIPEKKLYSISVWRKTGYYSEQETCLLVWSEMVVLTKKTETEKETAFKNMTVHWSTKEIIQFTFAISQIHQWNLLATSFALTPGEYTVGQYS